MRSVSPSWHNRQGTGYTKHQRLDKKMPGVGDAGLIESQGSETVKIASSVAVHQEEVERLRSRSYRNLFAARTLSPALFTSAGHPALSVAVQYSSSGRR